MSATCWSPAASAAGLLLAIMATIDPGDEAIFLDPYFVMYKHLLSLTGGEPVIVDSYPDFRFHADRVEKAITPRTKLLILNSPSNPTGVVMTPRKCERRSTCPQAWATDPLRRNIRAVFVRPSRGLPFAGRHLRSARCSFAAFPRATR